MNAAHALDRGGMIFADRSIRVAGRDWREQVRSLARRAVANDVMVKGCGPTSCTPPVACFPAIGNTPAGGNAACAGGYRTTYVSGVSLAVAAAAQGTITIQLKLEFLGTKLKVPAAIAGEVTVDSVKVGNVEMLGGGSAGGFVFSSDQEDSGDLLLNYAPPGQTITILMTNISGAAVDMRATLIGWTR